MEVVDEGFDVFFGVPEKEAEFAVEWVVGERGVSLNSLEFGGSGVDMGWFPKQPIGLEGLEEEGVGGRVFLWGKLGEEESEVSGISEP